MAWNIGGPGLYEAQFEYLKEHPRHTHQFRIYMTKIYKDYDCDVFYPTETWNEILHNFRELKISEDVQDLGQIINDDGNVAISFHVYELNLWVS